MNATVPAPKAMTKAELKARVDKMVNFSDYAPKTRKAYSKWIDQFCDYISFETSDELDIYDGQDFLLFLDDQKKYAPSTMNQAVYAMRFFFEAVLLIPVTRKMFPKKKVEKKEKPCFKPDQAVQLIQQCKDRQLKAAIILAFTCGLRINEVTSIQFKDINNKSHSITIRLSKGKKTRTVYYGTSTKDILNDYVNKCDIRHHPDDYLFPREVTKNGQKIKNPEKPLKNSALTQRFSVFIQDFSFTLEGHTFHSLRHAYASALADLNVPLPVIQKAMGHTSSATTAKYIHSARPVSDELPDIFEILSRNIKSGDEEQAK